MNREDKKLYTRMLKLRKRNLERAEADKDPKNLCREAYVNQRNRSLLAQIELERYFGGSDAALLRVVKLPDEFK